MAQLKARGEQSKAFKVFRDFAGVNTQSQRTNIDPSEFAWLENLQPIGPANLRTVPGISSELVNYSADTVYYAQSVNINNIEYIISFAPNGKVFAFNVAASTSTQINAPATLLSGANSRVAQWKGGSAGIALFIDSTGYYSWNGTTFAKITGTGVPTAGDDIAVYSNRVWIVSGRILYYSAADDYIASAWAAGSGTGFSNLTDSTLRSGVQRLYAANGYLYLFGLTSVNVISDVRVPSGSTAPIFTNLNIQTIVGTDQPASVFPWNRTLMFATRYGAHGIDGVEAQRISAKIDGTWQEIDFSQSISGGSVMINNILSAAFLIKWNDPNLGLRTIIAMFSDGKWWFGTQGTNVTFIVTAMKNNVPCLFGYINNRLYQLFSNTATSPAASASSALWDMGDPLSDKQSIRVGFEATITGYRGTFSSTVDTEQSELPSNISSSLGRVTWIDANNVSVNWINNLSNQVFWVNTNYNLFNGDATAYGKYMGLTFNSTSASYQLSGFLIEYELRARW